MQLVYSLAKQGDNVYDTLAYLSAAAARRFHPDVKITVLTDEASLSCLNQWGKRIAEIVDDFRIIPLDEPSVVKRSRILKLSARKFVSGDFLYLDADAIPVRPFADIFDNPCEFGAVLESRDFFGRSSFHRANIPVFTQMGWTYPAKYYFNGGVWLCRDTVNTQLFFQNWLDLWHKQTEQLNVFYDQPALSFLSSNANFPVAVLPDKYNVRPRDAGLIADARIWHFITAKGQIRPQFILHSMVNQMNQTDCIDWSIWDAAIRRNSVWSDSVKFPKMRTLYYSCSSIIKRILRTPGNNNTK